MWGIFVMVAATATCCVAILVVAIATVVAHDQAREDVVL
jgi:hypothetical protein